MTKPKNPDKAKRAPRVGVPVRFAPESIPLMDETAAHMGHKSRSEMVRVATALYVQQHHPVHGRKARSR